MTGTQVLIIVLLVIGIAAVIASTFLSETALATKKEKQRIEERKAEAKKEFDNYLEVQMKGIREKIETFETETFATLSKNAAHDIEVASNEAVEKISNKTDEVKKQMDELFETAKKEIETLDSNYLSKLEDSHKEVEKKADDILDKAMKDLELVKEDAKGLVADLEKACYESADKAAKDAIDELDIITVFKELYEKSNLHKKGDKEYHSEENAVEEPVKTDSEIVPETVEEEEMEEPKECQETTEVKSDNGGPETTTDSESEKEETKSCEPEFEEIVAKAVETELEKVEEISGDEDPEIEEIKELAKQIENTDFEVSEEEIEKIKEKENLTNDKKTDNILDLTETDELDKTKIIPKIEEEFEFVEEDFPTVISAEKATEIGEVVIEDAVDFETAPVAEEVFEEPVQEVLEEKPEEESMLFKVMRENDIFSSDIDEATVSEVLRLNKRKKTSMQIANELGIGIAEVRTIIDLFTD